MTLEEKALTLATEAHEGQLRKEGTPYITHPIAVAEILKTYGFPESVIAAAYVHDVLEDTSVTEEDLRAALGDEVTEIVKEVSEDKSLPYEERKRRYVEAVRVGSEFVKALSTADKVHNARSFITLSLKDRDAAWQLYRRGREQKEWFDQLVLDMLVESWKHPLVDEYAVLVAQMKALP